MAMLRGVRWAAVILLVLAGSCAPVEEQGESPPRAPPPPPASGSVAGVGGASDAEPDEAWGTQSVSGGADVGLAPALLTGVRIAAHEGFDRIVIEMEGGLPEWEVRYQEPAYYCGSGFPVEDVETALSIRLSPANAHDTEGQVTIAERDVRPGLTSIERALITCDFEAEVEWVLEVPAVRPFRVLELADPTRLVVDVRH